MPRREIRNSHFVSTRAPQHRVVATIGAVMLVALAACDEKPAPQPAATVAEAPKAAPTPTPTQTAAPTPPPDRLPDLLVDDQGPLIGNERVDMLASNAKDKLSSMVGKLAVKDKVVTVAAVRNAKTQYVAALVGALGSAGATEIDIKTPGRAPNTPPLKLSPERMVAHGIADCAVVAMVKKDSTSAVWRLKGGTAARFAKGFAGPDLSMTLEGIKKEVTSCPATTWFFSGEDNVIWGLTFDLGTTVSTQDPPLKTTTSVLLQEAPVAGRAVKLQGAS